MVEWKRVNITFPTVKLDQFIEPVKKTIAETKGDDYSTVYGVTNTEGITVTGKKTSKDISKYIVIDEGCFAYNPYRINVGSIGFNDKGLKGCVSSAYVVFKTRAGFNPEFLFLYLKSDFGNHLINWYGNRGGVRNALRYDDLCKIDVPKIDINEQSILLKKIKRIESSVIEFNSGIDSQLAILKQLRQAVLQEAIEGKLTSDWRKEHSELISGENHASKLLEKIKSEKEKLIKEGKIRKDKLLSPIADNEKPFDLPNGWVWARLGDLVSILGDGLHGTPNYTNNGEYFFINGNNLNEGEILIKDHTKRVSLDEYNRHKKELTDKTVLVSINGTLGNVAFYNNEKIILGKSACYFNLLTGTSKHYIKQIIKTKYFIIYASDKASETTIKNLSLKGMRMFLVPLPSIVEQQIIIERVDKLMAMIDELEKQVTDRKSRSEMLMQSVLREVFSR